MKNIFGNQVEEYVIGNEVKKIGDKAFNGCTGLTSVTIGNSVTSIGDRAFYGCTGLTSINIPNSVTSIGSNAFSSCSGLTSLAISNSVTSIGNSTFSYCSGLTSLTIPNRVTSIGSNAFFSCSGLTSVIIGNRVTSIGDHAFWRCNGLISVNIPNSVTNISDGAFCDCSKLTSITIGESVSSIGGNAFSGCFKLANIVLKATTVDTWLQKIPINGGQITLGSNVNKIVADAFLYKNDVLLKALAPTPPLLESALPIESVEVLKGSTCDYALAENWNKMKKIYAVENEKEYYPVVIKSEGESLVRVDGSERGCEIPANSSVMVSVVNNERIQDGDCLVYTIHHNITQELQQGEPCSFAVMPNIADNIVYTYTTDTSHSCIANLNASGTLLDHVGTERVNNIYYLKVSGELNGTDMRVIGKMPNLRILDMSEAQIVEGGLSYYGNNNYTKNNTIGEYFFAGQQQLLKVILPQTITTVGKKTFLNQNKLIDVVFPDNSLTTIGSNAFQGCSSLKSTTLPKTISSIGGNVFSGCSFEDVKILCPKVGDWFKGMTTIKELYLGDSVITISGSAFNGCSGITSVNIPINVTSIGESAFAKCTNLLNVTSLNAVPPTIQSSTFDSKTKQTATLNVPVGCKAVYWLAPYWGDFTNIVEFDASGIKEIANKSKPLSGQHERVYTLSGQFVKVIDTTRQQELKGVLPTGVYIINGEKVIVK